MPDTRNLQVNGLDLGNLSLDSLDGVSHGALWHAVHEILDTADDSAAVAAFNSYTPPPSGEDS